MATLEKIRENGKWLLIGFVGLALFAFIIEGFLQSGSTFFNQSKENVVVVNGESFHYQNFINKVEERSNALKRGNPGRSFTDDEQNQIRQMVINEEIDNILFTEETEKLGLSVSKDEYREMVMGNNISPVLQQIPDFKDPQTGRFDQAALMRFLQMVEGDNADVPEEYWPQLEEMKRAWLTVEQQIIQERLHRKFNALLTSAILVNDVEAEAAYANNKTSVDFDYVAQSYSVIPDDAVSVSDAEIQKLYNERKNQYKQDAAQVIDFIAVNILPDPVDFQNVETKLLGLKEQLAAPQVREVVQNNSDISYIDAYVAYSTLTEEQKTFVNANSTGAIDGPVLNNGVYNLYKLEGEKTAPDSIKVNVLALPVSYDDKQFAQLTDSLLNVVKSGTSFTDMATSATGGQSNGEMGWVTEAQLTTQIDSKFKDEVFAASLNVPFVAKSNGGSFLVQVTEKTQPVKKYKLANIQVRVMPSQETKTRLYNELSQFVSANHSIAALKEKAAEAGYAIQNDVEIAKDQININGIQGTRQVIQWAFNNKKGAISDIYEVQNSEYFVVAVVENQLKEGFRPLNLVSDMLKRELINEKKGAKLVADLKAKNLTTLEQYAEAMNATSQPVKFMTFATPNISGIGSEPVLNVEVPNLAVNQVSAPIAGKNRVYVVLVTDKRDSETAYDADSQRRQLQMQNMYRSYQLTQNPELLRENAKITNNSLRFF
ncbi:MAG: SurA N-terminal domain-containing protein [Dysgonamonadaceae bacterium]|jgi:peptidyl-prolyl cis-trans isomerase D|nr:SurA N-terminal domain-containing protein [Dysgonamonadaceae bacterium]